MLSRWIRTWGGVGLLFTVGFTVGCSFQGGLGSAKCERDGARQEGRVCRGGYWVATDAAGGMDGCTPSEESCNGRDDDCDGVVDEGCSCQFRGLNEGVCSGDETRGEGGNCEPPSNWIADEGESGGCGDMLDNDCDGQINENCNCTPGEKRDCYSGPSETLGVGICSEGTMTCQPGGSWGPCEGQTTQHVEAGQRCQNGKDDDCDGVVDEGCPCGIDGRTEGVCSGLIRRDDGTCPKPDEYEKSTDTETACDTKDNDCDGTVDEGCPCGYDGTHLGVCGDQTRQPDGTCPKPAEYMAATDDESPNCDGRDNDCDGLTDEGCSCDSDGRPCYSGPPGTSDQGLCETGTQPCESGTWGATCEGEQLPAMEVCDNDKDEDCDGGTDEDCACNYKDKDTGVCKGLRTNREGECPEPAEFLEDTDDESPKCDGLDNDCDGVVDEGCRCNYNGNSAGVCGNARIDKNGDCAKPEDHISMSEEETGEYCDGKDNDCDGVTDEDGCPCDYKGLDRGVCKDQTRTSQGMCPKPADYEPIESSCDDGLDNDCDGDADLDDLACKKKQGESCSGHKECLGKCISGSNGQECSYAMFVTSKKYTGKLGGLSGADAKCQRVADQAGLPGTWRAILSDASTSAKSRITVDNNVYNLDKQGIAGNSQDLWDGDINNAVARDEQGETQKSYVWTGTDENGNRDEGGNGENCQSWSSAASGDDAEVGHSDEDDNNWIIDAQQLRSCDQQAALYCINGQ